MRGLLRALVAILVAGVPAGAQKSAPESQTTPTAGLSAKLRQEIERLASQLDLQHVPPPDSFTVGGRTIPASTTVRGDVAVVGGPLDVRGRVEGNAISLHGDINVNPGGVITGDAIAVTGRVYLLGGSVQGEMRSLSSAP